MPDIWASKSLVPSVEHGDRAIERKDIIGGANIGERALLVIYIFGAHILGYIARLSQFGGRGSFSCLWCYYLLPAFAQPSNSHDSKKARSALQ
jgi:hypothetical protein